MVDKVELNFYFFQTICKMSGKIESSAASCTEGDNSANDNNVNNEQCESYNVEQSSNIEKRSNEGKA